MGSLVVRELLSRELMRRILHDSRQGVERMDFDGFGLALQSTVQGVPCSHIRT